MTTVLGFDTATSDTVVALLRDGAEPVQLRHAPAEGERPGHAGMLLPLAREVLASAGLDWPAIGRIGVGVGPGTFTGLRIGVATARALAQASGAELVAVSTLQALAAAAAAEHEGPILAVLDARRGEAFAAAYDGGREVLREPVAIPPEALPEQVSGDRRPWLAVGDGAVRFRDQLESAGVHVPADDSPLHHVSAIALCRLARDGRPVDRDALIPEYVRAPDARPR